MPSAGSVTVDPVTQNVTGSGVALSIYQAIAADDSVRPVDPSSPPQYGPELVDTTQNPPPGYVTGSTSDSQFGANTTNYDPNSPTGLPALPPQTAATWTAQLVASNLAVKQKWAAEANSLANGLITYLSGGGGGTPSGPAGGDLTGTYPDPSLATSGVTAGSYGDTANYPTFTVDAKGRITVAGTQSIPTSLPPNGSAGGDLTGTYPNPGVGALKGQTVSAAATSAGQVLSYNGSTLAYEIPAPTPVAFVVETVSTTQSGPVTVGSRGFDPSVYPASGLTLKLWAVGQVAVTGDTLNIVLTDSTSAVVICAFTVTSTTQVELSQTITVSSAGTNTIANSRKTYTVTIYRSGGSSSDAVTLHSLYLEVSY